MRSLLVILGLMVVSLVLMVVIGAALPKAHTSRSSARYHRPPEEIWQTITNYQQFTQWRHDLKSVEPMASQNGMPAWREKGSSGDVPYQVMELKPPSRMVTRIADPKLPFGGTWTYEITPAENGCVLTITEDGEVYNPAFRFISRFVMGQHATINNYLRALGRKYGDFVTPQNE